jgi:hypothetical protein
MSSDYLLKDVGAKDPEELDQLPSSQRRYIDDTEIGELRNKGFRIYTGARQGMYIDATAEWLDTHAQKGHEPVTDPKSPFVHLVPHPEHGANIYEYENGDEATDAKAPKGEDGKKLKRKQDKNGNDVIVEHKQTRNRGNKGIPPGAVDVHVALKEGFPIQAKWRNPKTGELGISYSHARAKELKDDHWSEYRDNRSDIQKGVRALRRMSGEALSQSPTDTCLALVGLLGIRHGGDERTHEDGEPTGSGAVDLKVKDIQITGDSMVITFRGKHDRPQRFVKRNRAVATAIQMHMEGKEPTDKIFDTNTKKNARRLKELTGNDKVKVKDLRTDYANYTAKEAIAEYFEGDFDKPFETEKEFKRFQDAIGLTVGTALGHKKKVEVKNSAGKTLYESDGETPQTEFVFHSKEAISSYIDPEMWEPFKPKQDIQNAYTPDWHDKTPMQERDIDEYADARKRKGENRQWGIKEFGGQRKPLVKTWIQSLSEQGFAAPVIKEATAQQMWFLNNGIDYVGTFGLQGDVFVEKATFKPTFNKPGISYNPAGRNRPKEEKKDVQSLNLDEVDDF